MGDVSELVDDLVGQG